MDGKKKVDGQDRSIRDAGLVLQVYHASQDAIRDSTAFIHVMCHSG